MNILVLGDGNFSFSLCFLRKLLGHNQSVARYICTSYDSLEALTIKYPEYTYIYGEIIQLSSRFCSKNASVSLPSDFNGANSSKQNNQLANDNIVSILHDIDATLSLEKQLTIHGMSEELRFDYVIFNFPHLGIENCEIHSSLLAHVMHEACKVMRDDSSKFLLALSKAQFSRWKAADMAMRSILRLIDEVPLISNQWEGYEFKRHQSGKSFRARLDDCYHYVFSMSPDSSNIFRQLYESAVSSVLLQDSNPIYLSERSKQVKPSKRRRVPDLTRDMYIIQNSISSPTASVVLEPTWQCLTCRKTFKSEGAVQTHCYTTHILQTSTSAISLSTNNQELNGTNDSLKENNVHICTHCGTRFTNQKSLDDHCISKHGMYDAGVRADNLPRYQRSTNVLLEDTHTEALEMVHECSVCGWKFESHDACVEHMDGWKPIDKTKHLRCTICNVSKFTEERALSQHMNYCFSKLGASPK